MSVKEMLLSTPRRSGRIPYTHTPKISERKKGLFQSEPTPHESLTKHRHQPVVDSESDSDDCDLGIISTLDSSSGDENDKNLPKTPERTCHNTRSATRRLLKQNHDLKNFIKSPFTLNKYQKLYSCTESTYIGSSSTPATPHVQNHPQTPSSTHSCASAYTNSSTSGKARKSLASLIADTESCSSSLKDLNFDTDSSADDSKENTPRSRNTSRKSKYTPKFQSFKGILLEQKENCKSPMNMSISPNKSFMSPMKTAVVCLTKMDMSKVTNITSPTQMLKTPHNNTDVTISPPKLGHSRRSLIEIGKSPEHTCDSEKSHKRLRSDNMTEGPVSKHARLETNAPKARLNLFNSDRLKEILSAKSFYGKSNPELNSNVTAKIATAIEVVNHRRPYSHSHSYKRKSRPGQINMGVRHRIRKPKIRNKVLNKSLNNVVGLKDSNKSVKSADAGVNIISSTRSHNDILNSSQELDEKIDLFGKEKQTIEALLSQWTEEEIPESELTFTKPRAELSCFNGSVIEETNHIFQPVTAMPVPIANLPQDSEVVIQELGAQKNVANMPQDVVMAQPSQQDNHRGNLNIGEYLPVDGGYILVDENVNGVQEELTDLDAIDREMRMLDEQLLKIAESNNIDAEAVFASTETVVPTVVTEVTTPSVSSSGDTDGNETQKLFSIFNKPNTGTSASTVKDTSEKAKKPLLKNGSDQYVIDAGQKKFGATQCSECEVIYQIGDPQDEHDHLVHHNATNVLRFNGWKDECVVGRWGGGRVVRVRGGEAGWKRVVALLERVVHPQLGYMAAIAHENVYGYTGYLYIDNKKIVGCLIVQPKVKAHKLLPGDPDCCSVEEYPVKCGVSRVWTHINHRRRGIARRLLDCARASFLYGDAMRPEHVAFSAPTPAGKAFAANYCGTDKFYVYLE